MLEPFNGKEKKNNNNFLTVIPIILREKRYNFEVEKKSSKFSEQKKISTEETVRTFMK